MWSVSSSSVSLRGVSTASASFRLPAFEVPVGTFVVSLRVVNFLGSSSGVTSVTVAKSQSSLPQVAVLGPSQQTVLVGQRTVVVARAAPSVCADSTRAGRALRFRWSIVDSTDPGLQSGAVALSGPSVNRPRLIVPRSSFHPGYTYTLKVDVWHEDQPSLSSSAAVVLTASARPLRANIRGGASRIVASNSAIVLNGLSSRDPARIYARSQLQFSWRCTDARGQPCVDAGSLSAVPLSLASVPRLYLSASRLAAGTYRFTLTVSTPEGAALARSSEASADVTVLPRGMSSPVVFIDNETPLIPSDGTIVLRGSAYSRFSASRLLHFRWTVLQVVWVCT